MFRFLLFISLIAIGCTEKKHNGISIKKVGKLQFRRSYASAVFDSTLNVDSIQKGNAASSDWNDSALLKRFREFWLVDSNDALKRSMFTEEYKTFELTSGDKKITGWIVRPADDSTMFGLYDLELIRGKERYRTRLEGHYGVMNEDIKYLLLDIIPGGYKEFVALEEYYIMNGDNSDVYIYEIKDN